MMRMCGRFVFVAFALVAAVFGIAWAKGDWSAAQGKAEDMKRKQMDLRKLAPDEIRRVVAAVCEADEDERKDVGRTRPTASPARSAASSAASSACGMTRTGRSTTCSAIRI